MAVKPTRIGRKEALGMEEMVRMYIRSMKLSAGLNTQRIFAAWDEATGAAGYTLRRFFRGGCLYVTLNSSLVRTSLEMQKDLIIMKMNDLLRRDSLFVEDDGKVSYVERIVLK